MSITPFKSTLLSSTLQHVFLPTVLDSTGAFEAVCLPPIASSTGSPPPGAATVPWFSDSGAPCLRSDPRRLGEHGSRRYLCARDRAVRALQPKATVLSLDGFAARNCATGDCLEWRIPRAVQVRERGSLSCLSPIVPLLLPSLSLSLPSVKTGFHYANQFSFLFSPFPLRKISGLPPWLSINFDSVIAP